MLSVSATCSLLAVSEATRRTFSKEANWVRHCFTCVKIETGEAIFSFRAVLRSLKTFFHNDNNYDFVHDFHHISLIM